MANELSLKRYHLLVVTPVFNEVDLLAEFTSRLGRVRDQLQKVCDVRVLFVDDGSRDQSANKILSLALQDNWIGLRRLSGNFGHQAALIAGLSAVDDWADLAVTMDSDLEHPPEVIIEMFEKWTMQKCMVVRGVRQTREELPLLKKLSSKLFYFVTGKLTGLTLLNGQTDFCLWDAQIIRELKPYLHSIGSLRVFSSWLPGEKTNVSFAQGLRKQGDSSRYTFKQNWNLTLNSILRFSSKPLRLISVIGFFGIGVSAIHGLQIIYAILTNEPLQPGWTTLIFSVIFMGCLQLICLGILASYLRRLVFSKDLPLFLVKEDKLF